MALAAGAFPGSVQGQQSYMIKYTSISVVLLITAQMKPQEKILADYMVPIANLTSLTRKDGAKTFSAVWANDHLFKTRFSSLALFFFIKISNTTTDTFPSVSVFAHSEELASRVLRR